MINRVVPRGDGVDREDREALDLVVIPGVIPVGPLIGHLVGVDVTFEDDFAVRRHHEVVIAADIGHALGQIGFLAAQ